MSLKGALKDEQLEIITDGGILIENDIILAVDNFQELIQKFPTAEVEKIETEQVLLPGFIDSHTHICFGGNRAKDFAMRLDGKTYLEIAESGGGIWSTVQQTRAKTADDLKDITLKNVEKLIRKGTTTAEVKSGYALSIDGELKMLEGINLANQECEIDLIPTFLGAHMKAKDFNGTNKEYLEQLVSEVFPKIKADKLANRIDIFVEQSAFSVEEGDYYLNEAKKQGFQITIHADQFTSGGSELAIKYNALSADHLEFFWRKRSSIFSTIRCGSNGIAWRIDWVRYAICTSPPIIRCRLLCFHCIGLESRLCTYGGFIDPSIYLSYFSEIIFSRSLGCDHLSCCKSIRSFRPRNSNKRHESRFYKFSNLKFSKYNLSPRST